MALDMVSVLEMLWALDKTELIFQMARKLSRLAQTMALETKELSASLVKPDVSKRSPLSQRWKHHVTSF